MKKYELFLFMIAIGLGSYAQTGGYKKIMNERHTVNKDVFYDQLLRYQKENTEYANVYYQLGKIELEIFSELDPIVDRVASRQRIYNAKTDFGLAKNYLDKKEISKSPDWYDVPDLKDTDSVTRMGVKQVESNYENTKRYAKSYEELIENYDRAVYHYLKAREVFIAINTSADNLRQLFLKADDSLKMAVKAVGVSFDSSMYHLDIYRAIYQQLPYKKKRQVTVNRRKIDHFRMNGITPANFLADNIDVWDYKEWSDRFLKLLKEEVDGLQDEIRSAYTFFMTTNDKMLHDNECIQAELDDLKFQRIINLVSKYDNESVLIDVFQYLMAKLDYGNKLTYERNCNKLTGLPTDDFISRKARIYQNLFYSFQRADSLASHIVSTNHSQESFQWFFDEMMPGENGSTTFATNQKQENIQTFKNELLGLLALVRKQTFDVDTATRCFGPDDVYLILEGSSSSESFCASKSMAVNDTLHFLQGRSNDNQLLIAGYPDGSDYRKLWEAQPYKNTRIDFFKIVGDSTFVMGGLGSKAWIKQHSIQGQEYYNALLKDEDTIKNVAVNQLQGVATILQRGIKDYAISRVNFNGKVEASVRLGVKEDYAGFIKQERNWWLFTYDKSPEGVSKVTAWVYDEIQSKIVDTVYYTVNQTIIKPTIIKNDNEFLTLISSTGASEDQITYILMNYEGKIEGEITL